MLDGLLLVDKPSGPTSYDLIRWIKRKVNVSTDRVKIGHCGTLDPLASGLMIILLGKSTKRQSELMGQEKVYRCTMRLGFATDSGDITGKTIETTLLPSIKKEFLDELQKKLIGTHSQIPPMFSAIKQQGTPLYKLARKGQVVVREPRLITIHEFEFLKMDGTDIEFRVRCSSGTYVRTLVEDIGKMLGTLATMAALTREKIGAYALDEAVQGNNLKEMDEQQLEKCLRFVA